VRPSQTRNLTEGGYLLPLGENEKIFTKSAFLPSDFAKYVRNTRWICGAWGIFFFWPYKIRGLKIKSCGGTGCGVRPCEVVSQGI
jgi:hypothetical protein